MLAIVAQTWGLTVLCGVLGAALGFGLELMLGQAGWALVGGSVGLCAGAIVAGARATPEPRAMPATPPAPDAAPPPTE